MATTPDIRYDSRKDNTARPSWSANPGHLNDEHHTIFDATKDIPGWQHPVDTYKLYEMAWFAGDVILEIGVYGGRSAVVELRGALANPSRTSPPQFFGLDIDHEAVTRSHRTLAEAGLAEHALLYRGDLGSFLADYYVRPTMVFVDGDHSYEGVRRDLDVLANALPAGIPVLCHDYTNPTHDHGVMRAADDWEKGGYATLSGVFGCAGLFVTTDACRGPLRGPGPERFEELRVRHLQLNGLAPVQDATLRALQNELVYARELISTQSERIDLLMTPTAAARRLVAEGARRLGIYDRVKRLDSTLLQPRRPRTDRQS